MDLEDQIAQLVSQGYQDGQIQQSLRVAESTVYNHVSNLYSIAGISGIGSRWRTGKSRRQREMLIDYLRSDEYREYLQDKTYPEVRRSLLLGSRQCPYCKGRLVKAGRSAVTKVQRYICKECRKVCREG